MSFLPDDFGLGSEFFFFFSFLSVSSCLRLCMHTDWVWSLKSFAALSSKPTNYMAPPTLIHRDEFPVFDENSSRIRSYDMDQ